MSKKLVKILVNILKLEAHISSEIAKRYSSKIWNLDKSLKCERVSPIYTCKMTSHKINTSFKNHFFEIVLSWENCDRDIS